MKKASLPTLISQKGDLSQVRRLPKSRRTTPRPQPQSSSSSPAPSPADQPESTSIKDAGSTSAGSTSAADKKARERSRKHSGRAVPSPVSRQTSRKTSRKTIADSSHLSGETAAATTAADTATPAAPAKALRTRRRAGEVSARQSPDVPRTPQPEDGLPALPALSPLPTATADNPPPRRSRTVRPSQPPSPSLSSSLSSSPLPTAEAEDVISKNDTIQPQDGSQAACSALTSSTAVDVAPDLLSPSRSTLPTSSPAARSTLKMKRLKAKPGGGTKPSPPSPRKRNSSGKRTQTESTAGQTEVLTSTGASVRPIPPARLFSIERQSINLYHHAMKFFHQADYAGAKDTLQLLLSMPSLDPELASRAKVFLNICSQKALDSGSTS